MIHLTCIYHLMSKNIIFRWPDITFCEKFVMYNLSQPRIRPIERPPLSTTYIFKRQRKYLLTATFR